MVLVVLPPAASGAAVIEWRPRVGGAVARRLVKVSRSHSAAFTV